MYAVHCRGALLHARSTVRVLCCNKYISVFVTITLSLISHRFVNYGVDNKSVYPCGSVVATVVRIPRSEVSERHRAGSWVWVVAKIRLEIW